MKIINKKNNQVTFSAEIDESLANAIRRYVNQIPVLAIDEVEISKNDSPLYDETIAHRIGLIPLKMDENIDGKLKLVTNKEGIVYSGDINGKIKPVYDNIPITVLRKGQGMELIATVKAGIGSEHSKFSPGFVFYRNMVNVKVDKDCPKEVINACPKGILKADGKVSAVNEAECDMCEACIDMCKKMGKNSIELIPTGELAITIESFGQISEEDIFKKAIGVLKNDLKEVAKKFSK